MSSVEGNDPGENTPGNPHSELVLLMGAPQGRRFDWIRAETGRIAEVVGRRRRSHGRPDVLRLRGITDDDFWLVEVHVEPYELPAEEESGEDVA